MKKRIVAVTCVLMFCLGLIGCGTERANKTQQLIRGAAPGYNDGLIRVGMIQTGKESDWRDANTNDYLNTFTKERGYDLIYIDGNSSSERQVKAMYDLIQQKVDYIILQPIVENAVRYGNSADGMRRVEISAKRVQSGTGEELVRIGVRDHGKGFEPEEAERILTGNKTGSVGLKNVNERLKSTYGKRYGLEIRNTDDGAEVSFCIPYQAES